MRALLLALLLPLPALASDVAPTGTLRAVFLATNPAQATVDPASGARRGPAVALARLLAGDAPLELTPLPSPPAIVEAVRDGRADIGFVAYETTRLGTVAFSQTYMTVRQSFLVPAGSPIRGIADIDRDGQVIAGTPADSITLCLKRLLRRATAAEIGNDPAGIAAALASGAIQAFGANRQRLTTLAAAAPGTRLLEDDLFVVPQNIVVPIDRPAALAAVNAAIDRARANGDLQRAIDAGGAVGTSVAPPGVKAGCPVP